MNTEKHEEKEISLQANIPIYVVLKVMVRNNSSFDDNEDHVVLISTNLSKAQTAFDNIKLEKGKYWDTITKYIIKTNTDINYEDEDLINQPIVKEENREMSNQTEIKTEIEKKANNSRFVLPSYFDDQHGFNYFFRFEDIASSVSPPCENDTPIFPDFQHNKIVLECQAGRDYHCTIPLVIHGTLPNGQVSFKDLISNLRIFYNSPVKTKKQWQAIKEGNCHWRYDVPNFKERQPLINYHMSFLFLEVLQITSHKEETLFVEMSVGS